ncbi:unnamed protein product [marine sediment metagenome]|uniref:Uncharacterized protein n=1 Tax=marine sediment metagenome TaxID=412755 RepID=X0SYT1_9ZZZZ
MKAERYDREHKKDDQATHTANNFLDIYRQITRQSLGAQSAHEEMGSLRGQQQLSAYEMLTQPIPIPYSLAGTKSANTETFREVTCDYNDTKEGTIGKYEWEEIPISEYSSLPPKGVLEELNKQRKLNCFDYFTIASVNAVKDPLLLGRLNGSADRYFLAQWGEDISLDDVI